MEQDCVHFDDDSIDGTERDDEGFILLDRKDSTIPHVSMLKHNWMGDATVWQSTLTWNQRKEVIARLCYNKKMTLPRYTA